MSDDEWESTGLADLRMHHYVKVDTCYFFPCTEKLPYEEGGPPRTEADWVDLGLDLSKSIDPDRPKEGGGYHLLTQTQKNALYAEARRWWWVWSPISAFRFA